MDKIAIPVPTEEMKVIDMSDGVVIRQDNMLHTLNSTAFDIFKLCDGKRTIQRIIHKMKSHYSDEDIEKLVEDFIEQLIISGLIKI